GSAGPAKQDPAVVVVIPTYQRSNLLGRTLASLRDQGSALVGVVVVNNSSDAETARAVRESPVPTRLLDFGCNLGLAGGIAVGMREALRDPVTTHVWVLDDDVVASPE